MSIQINHRHEKEWSEGDRLPKSRAVARSSAQSTGVDVPLCSKHALRCLLSLGEPLQDDREQLPWLLMVSVIVAAAIPVFSYRWKICQMKLSPYATPSTKRGSERGGRCGSRAAGPGGIAGRCMGPDESFPSEPLGWAVAAAVSDTLSHRALRMRALCSD